MQRLRIKLHHPTVKFPYGNHVYNKSSQVDVCESFINEQIIDILISSSDTVCYIIVGEVLTHPFFLLLCR